MINFIKKSKIARLSIVLLIISFLGAFICASKFESLKFWEYEIKNYLAIPFIYDVCIGIFSSSFVLLIIDGIYKQSLSNKEKLCILKEVRLYLSSIKGCLRNINFKLDKELSIYDDYNRLTDYMNLKEIVKNSINILTFMKEKHINELKLYKGNCPYSSIIDIISSENISNDFNFVFLNQENDILKNKLDKLIKKYNNKLVFEPSELRVLREAKKFQFNLDNFDLYTDTTVKASYDVSIHHLYNLSYLEKMINKL